MVNNIFRFLFLAVVAFLLILSAACSKAAATSTSTTPRIPGPQSAALVQNDINILAQTNLDYSFMVEDYMKDVKVTGSFSTFGGAPNSIQVYIMDDTTYNSWVKGRTVPILFSSGSLSMGEINQAITTPGKYHLTFSNTYPASVADAQQVKVDIVLNWTN
jgi:hypothetical protein